MLRVGILGSFLKYKSYTVDATILHYFKDLKLWELWHIP